MKIFSWEILFDYSKFNLSSMMDFYLQIES